MDCNLPISFVQIDMSTRNDVFFGGGSGLNIITEEVQVRLGLPTPKPYRVHMVGQALIDPVGLKPDVCIEVHSISVQYWTYYYWEQSCEQCL